VSIGDGFVLVIGLRGRVFRVLPFFARGDMRGKNCVMGLKTWLCSRGGGCSGGDGGGGGQYW
jgi:hypothetical protein